MQFDLWGADIPPSLIVPERPLGYVLLAVYALLFLLILYGRRREIVELTGRKWLAIIGLMLLSITFSQLFLISISSESQLPPPASAQNPVAYLSPLLFVPFLLAGVTINPVAALLVGFSAGLGRALWQTHQLTDPFQLAFAAVLASYLMQQNYSGRLYAALRQPVVGGLFSASLMLPLTGLATFAYAGTAVSYLAALDLALSTTTVSILPLFVEGIFGGGIVTLLLIGLPQLRRQRKARLSPLANSLNTRLMATFLIFASLLAFLLVVIGFNLATRLATTLAVQQMARDAQATSTNIPEFIAFRQNLLVQAGNDDKLLSADAVAQQKVLEQTFRSGDFFRSVILVNGSYEILAQYPEDSVSADLTDLELSKIEDTILSGAPFQTPAQEVEEGLIIISLGVPVHDQTGKVVAVIIGRVPQLTLEQLVTSLQGTLGQGVGFIIDEANQYIGHPQQSNLLKSWASPAADQQGIVAEYAGDGAAYESLQGSTNIRQLTYILTGPDHPWTVVITVPYEVVLAQALQIAGQLAIVLLAALVLFGSFLLLLGRSISSPLTELVSASQQIADGKLNTTIEQHGDDEIGRLGFAFGQMQIALKRRLDELSLLLDVSQEVSRSIDLNQGMPSVLKGALRGTGAASARVAVLNPTGGHPKTFGEGPANQDMAAFDRKIMTLIRHKNELIFLNADDVIRVLANGQVAANYPKMLIALPLTTNERFQGVLWLTYRQNQPMAATELSFLRTLSHQASILVENARLFAIAEGGRRRLAAVLTSTSDGVIVTDPTERIILFNPAMERFFNLKAPDMIGRPVRAVLFSDPLIEALTSTTERTQNFEIITENGLALFASASDIFNNEGQAIGRVAVLHDITSLKEIDKMKSEFVATVSHDLRSPLTFMLGYTTMLPMVGNLEPKQQEYVDKIVGGIEQMTGLVDGLLDLGRLEAGIELVQSRLRVSEILISVFEEYRQPARSNGIELVMSVDGQLPVVWADASLIRQAVANYVNNAVKYAPDSGEVLLNAKVVGKLVVISVQDYGPGISEKDRVHLFEKFFRIPQYGKKQIKGTGLGLALVKSIADRHHGRAWCESQLGQGSIFYLALPIYTGNS